jgi:hypothetical protein
VEVDECSRDITPVNNEDRQWTPHTLGCNIPKATLLLGSPSVWKETKLEIVPGQ